MRINKYFQLEEFVYPELFQQRGWSAIKSVDSRIISSATQIREYTGFCLIINDWAWNPKGFELRGVRPFETKIGAEFSNHKYGRAIDFDLYEKGKRIESDEVREIVKQMKAAGKLFSITGMELGVNWCHIETSFSRHPEKIYLFKP